MRATLIATFASVLLAACGDSTPNNEPVDDPHTGELCGVGAWLLSATLTDGTCAPEGTDGSFRITVTSAHEGTVVDESSTGVVTVHMLNVARTTTGSCGLYTEFTVTDEMGDANHSIHAFEEDMFIDGSGELELVSDAGVLCGQSFTVGGLLD